VSREPYDPQVIELLGQIMELPPAQRAGKLDELCGHDPELRRRVQALLDHRSATAAPASVAPSEPFDAPAELGPYRLLELIGEGGMGSVYKAEQREPVRRIVAIKLIKLGMDTRQVVARFDSERQALAMMNHPNVAKVLDGGATDTGRPYFVMEYVAGEPITAYCDRHRLGTEQRLDLFRLVCDAVQHAHHKGIIHRDLKPTNVLVSLDDGRPVPKVIDFGVAKAVSQRLTERTFFTERGQLIGTPEYMSPEQAEMGALDVDTRTDVYSLGVLLYELLTGALPFDPKSLRQAAFGEIQRIIREVDPPRPSTRLSSLGEQSETVARSRGIDSGMLVKRLRGDLDWITMKAMEKDRTRRYANPSELASDIDRHLRHEPVQAGPPTVTYRARKFVRRNRGAVVAAGLVLLSIVAGVAATTVALIRESRQRAQAERQKLEAENATGNARAAIEFIETMMLSTHPNLTQGKPVMVLDVLDRAAENVETQLKDRPLVEASVRMTLGVAYQGLGQSALALPHVTRALDMRRQILGEEHLDTIASTTLLADVTQSLGRLSEAEALIRDVLGRYQRLLGDDHVDTLHALNRLAVVLHHRGQLQEAERLYRDVLARRQRVLGPEHVETLVSLSNLGSILGSLGRLQEAEALLRQVWQNYRRTLGEDHTNTLVLGANVAGLTYHLGRYREAEAILREVLERRKRVLGEDHAQTLAAMNMLGVVLTRLGPFIEAETLIREAMERRRRTLGNNHPDTLESSNNLAVLLKEQGRASDAEAIYRENFQREIKLLGPNHATTLRTANNLALALVELNRLAEAEELLRDALERRRSLFGDAHPDTLESLNSLGYTLQSAGRPADAEPIYREAFERCRGVLGPDHPDTLVMMHNLAYSLSKMDKPVEAEVLARDVLARRRRVLGEDHRDTLGSANDLGRILEYVGRHDEAAAMFRDALGRARRVLGEGDEITVALTKGLEAVENRRTSATAPSTGAMTP
jgi:serine/threonine protein kinase/tetratricopeptide (TPR) repeat protein